MIFSEFPDNFSGKKTHQYSIIMATVNRQIPPPVYQPDKLTEIDLQSFTLDNGVKMYPVDAGTQELMEIQGIFKAGSSYQPKPFVARFTNILLKEGSAKYSSSEISGILDFYGAYLNNSINLDAGTMSFFILNKHLNDVMPVIEDVIKNPVFPEKELEIYRANSIHDLRVKQEKVDFIARRAFMKQVYGERHPYGFMGEVEDFDNICREDLTDFHYRHYGLESAKILIAGKLPGGLADTMNRYFGQKDFLHNAGFQAPAFDMPLPPPARRLIHKDAAVQSAIVIGKALFNRKHPDYFDFSIMNTVLGGYFGSRLMKNIREEKGYTYGVHSGLFSHYEGGTFKIFTQVGCENTANALNEIYKEIEILQNDLIGEDELETVKNYLTGQLLRTFDGVFSLAYSVRLILEYDLGTGYFNDFLRRIREITPAAIRLMAQKYLALDSLHELVVGKMD